jgi:hypothetical protein
VTSKAALSDNIGSAETDEIFAFLKSLQNVFIVDIPKGVDVDQAAEQVRPFLQKSIKGVVILGGYDVVPPVRLDVLTLEQRQTLAKEGFESTRDRDDFIVYNDDIYADIEGDLYPEFPVSRIPDGRKAELIITALKAPLFTASQKFGIRNIARPFADISYGFVPGVAGALNITEHFRPDDITETMGQGAVYYMLHGIDLDGTRFLGETAGGVGLEAIRVDKLPKAASGSVVLAGCCWGALTALPTAMNKSSNIKFRPRSPEESIALSYLERGANAFVGCTASHYSPDDPPLDYYGKPIHDDFWKGISNGKSAALALFEAKTKYATEIPHGNDDPVSKAIELKLLRAFTCLGLGW